MITILLATYNGEKYLREQIESLLNQTVQDFIIYACDDLSTDGTYAILEEYHCLYPDKIMISKNQANTGNSKYNFMNMMIQHKDQYVMLCDQDDVWMPNKIEVTLNRMKEMESAKGKDMPILVHTDLLVVDENLNTISPSFMKAMVANYHKNALNNLLIQNTLTGCTAMYNSALANLLYKEPPYMIMHDWWLILVASAFGKVSPILEPTILYRQHGENSIGAKDVRTLKYKIEKLIKAEEIRQAIRETYVQADSLLGMYEELLSIEQTHLLKSYASIPQLSKIGRWIIIFQLRVFKNSFSRKIAQLMYI